MPKKIVLLSDGTGNSAAKLFKTNVWRLYQALDLQDPQIRAMYDDGVGTDHFAPIALLGGAVGFGLAQNIRELYAFLSRNYEPGDEIYAFGFSRGAFTIRALVGMITSVGLVKAANEAELAEAVAQAYREHRKQFKTNWVLWYEQLRAKAQPSFKPAAPKLLGDVPRIRFLGLWDTVAAYGLPIDELQRGIDRYFRAHSFPDRDLSSYVDCARHALALDDERRTFHPVLWSERGEKDPERIQQVWFAGVHSDVGGGYPKEALSYVPLVWIMQAAERAGLSFKAGAANDFARLQDPYGELHDSRSGLAAYYRYAPRDIATLSNDDYVKVHIERPKIHESVFERVRDGRVGYAPVGIPAQYDVVRYNSDVVAGTAQRDTLFEDLTLARARAGALGKPAAADRAWDFVWLRRLLYFATLAATLFLAAFPFLFTSSPDDHQGPFSVLEAHLFKPLVTHILGPLGLLLPAWTHTWISAFSQRPFLALCGGISILVTMWLSSRAQARIEAGSESAWHHVKKHPDRSKAYRPGLVYQLRSSQLLVAPYLWFARSVIPSLFAGVLGLLGLFTVNHAWFAVAAELERECIASSFTIVGDQPMTARVDLVQACNPTALRLERGQTYVIGLSWTKPRDEAAYSAFKAPLRRLLGKASGAPIMKVGAELAPLTAASSQTYTASSDGDLFVFANDAVVAWPWLWSSLYGNDHGQATIRVARTRESADETTRSAALSSTPLR